MVARGMDDPGDDRKNVREIGVEFAELPRAPRLQGHDSSSRGVKDQAHVEDDVSSLKACPARLGKVIR